MFVHAFGASLAGHKKILILANDSDIIVFGIRAFALWSVVTSMEKPVALALPGFHAFTGCDTTLSFKGKGKKTAWATWKSGPSYTTAFLELSGYNPKLDHVFQIL